MKKLLILTASIFLLQGARAQLAQGKIVFERTINMHRRMTDESMKAMVPEFDSAKMELSFLGDESVFRTVHEEEDIRNSAGEDGNRVMIKFGGADNETYKNYANDKIIELRELGPKKYIIEDTLQKMSWRLLDETKVIIGHNCKKATTKNKDGNEVIAWYTEDLPLSSGPEQFGGLPGMIVELNINDGEIVFAAREIITADFDKKWVQAPGGAKKITREEFQKMRDEEFGANPGGGPVIRIIRQ